MPLLRSRRALLEIITSDDIFDMLSDEWPYVRGLINDWLTDYKQFEKDDTFDAAFRESRMTIRWGQEALIYKNMQAVEGTAARTITTWENKITAIGQPKKWVKVNKNEKVGGESKAWAFPVDIGMEGIVKRVMGDHFLAHDGRMSDKYFLGLHDLSASVLNPRVPISRQTFNKITEGDLYAFMPLGDPEDQNVFMILKDLAKHKPLHNNVDFVDAVKIISTQFTRLKLACDHDMGTNFAAVPSKKPLGFKFQYGTSRLGKKRNAAGIVQSNKILTDHDFAIRTIRATNYKNILNPDPTKFENNEVVLAYRKHGGTDFPMFGKWDAAASVFRTISISGHGTNGLVIRNNGTTA